MQLRPVQGWGWQAAWHDPDFRALLPDELVTELGSHSAYFDVLLGGGALAGLLLVAVLGFSFASAGSRALEGPSPTCIPIALVTTVAVAASQESFLIGNHFLFALFVAGACWPSEDLGGRSAKAIARVERL